MMAAESKEIEHVDTGYVDSAVKRLGTGAHLVLDILQELQEHYGYLPYPALERVCEITDITPASLWGVATFYGQFRFSPAGRHRIQVCVGTACHVKGAEPVHEGFKKYLDIDDDEDTDEERNFTVEKVACLGCCTLAPAVQIGDVTYGHVTADTAGDVVENFLKYLEREERESGKKQSLADLDTESLPEIRISLDSCCVARGCGDIFKAAEKVLDETGIRARLKPVGCVGICDETPLLEVAPPDGKTHLYARVQPEDVKPILLRHFTMPRLRSKISHGISCALDRLITDEGRPPVTRHLLNFRDKQLAGYMDAQFQIATLDCNAEDPVDVESYLDKGGFDALRHCLENLTPAQVIERITRSGLRGRGGAGYSTGQKWEEAASSTSPVKYLICNGDEGDPGAFMDRMLLESCPFRIIEGIAIAAYAVGAQQGYVYIRAEYPVALKQVRKALDICRDRYFLGRNILGTGFGFDLEIKKGAGAFVCGEETALMEAVQGRRGMPKLRPPYPVRNGLWGKPTLVNNVETYANVSWIMDNGPDAFAALGTEQSRGTKVFSLAGKISRGALIEVPMGITLRDIVEKVGGGVPGGKELKAVQVGGPSGGCVPAHLADLPVDYEDLTEAGTMMGSGGLVVLDEDDCMVDIARYFLEFTQDQSCGRCTFCRVGTSRMLEILERLCAGMGKEGDIEKLEELCRFVSKGSLCGLGKTAPTPVTSTLEHFRSEYQAHIDGRCPALSCKTLIEYRVTDDCIGCTICAQNCPAEAIEMRPYEKHEIDTEKCTQCDVCKSACPSDAIIILS